MAKSKTALATAAARRAKAVALIESGKIHSQSDLVELLSHSGFEVTQATASRDLDEIGAVKSRNKKGEITYVLPAVESGISSTIPTQLILSVEASGNLCVVRTPPGGAQLLASALDRASRSNQLNSLIGTIAGDDTVLAISRKSNGGAQLSRELLSLGKR